MGTGFQKVSTDETDDIAEQPGGEENNGRQEQKGQRKGTETKHRQTATESKKETGETTQKGLVR